MTVSLHVEPVAGALGAIVHGVDVRHVDDDTVAAIRRALLDHEVIFFRDQDIDDDDQLAFAARFGTPSVFPMQRALGATEPSFSVIEDGPDSPSEADEWHTDVTWVAEPPMAAFLRASVIPERGGDTMWCSMTAAYEALSPTMRSIIDGLEVRHDNTGFIEGMVAKLGDQAHEMGLPDLLRERYPGVDHPLVRTHPETGRRALFLAGDFMRHIVGMHPHESRALLGFLGAHMNDARFHCRWAWRLGDLAVWDERSTNHRAVGDHFPHHRRIHRCTVDGDRPYFDPAVGASA